jgi:hypothetical protein
VFFADARLVDEQSIKGVGVTAVSLILAIILIPVAVIDKLGLVVA